jgi:hypothetical protein
LVGNKNPKEVENEQAVQEDSNILTKAVLDQLSIVHNIGFI